MISFKQVSIVLMLFLMISSVESHGWDGKRQGFILGFGIGAGSTSRLSGNNTTDGYTSERISAVAYNFKIGYAPNEIMEVYLTGKWATYQCSDMCGTKMSKGIGAVGTSYYFWSRLPSLFGTGGMGYSGDGLSVYGGAGFEFFPHLHFEFDVFWGQYNDPSYNPRDEVSWIFTLNALGY